LKQSSLVKMLAGGHDGGAAAGRQVALEDMERQRKAK
jgi:hypothetical protein